MSDSVRPHRRQPIRLPRPWDSQGKNTGVGCHFLLQCVKVKSLGRVWLLATPWPAAYQASPSMGFSRQEYWSGVPLPSPLLRIYYIIFGFWNGYNESTIKCDWFTNRWFFIAHMTDQWGCAYNWVVTLPTLIWEPGFCSFCSLLFPRTSNGNVLQYSCLANPMDGGAW